MRRAIVAPDGTLLLGDQAAARGFVPGAVVEISPTRAPGVLLVCLDQAPPPLDVPFRALVGGAAQLAARQKRRLEDQC